ncbi:hypothetical protein [Streptomyces sp. NPDC003832]
MTKEADTGFAAVAGGLSRNTENTFGIGLTWQETEAALPAAAFT